MQIIYNRTFELRALMSILSASEIQENVQNQTTYVGQNCNFLFARQSCFQKPINTVDRNVHLLGAQRHLLQINGKPDLDLCKVQVKFVALLADHPTL